MRLIQYIERLIFMFAVANSFLTAGLWSKLCDVSHFQSLPKFVRKMLV